MAVRASQNGKPHRAKPINRIDSVLIRKSGDQQDERAQTANVKRMLEDWSSADKSVTVPPDKYWFSCTVKRAKVQGNRAFIQLLRLVESDKVRNVYIESQDRFGTNDVCELYTLIGILRAHNTHLIDLKLKMDLTAQDDVTEMTVFMGGMKSKKERQDLAYRSMRTKVDNLNAYNSWPTGSHPFGFGKARYSEDGKLLWEWHPRNRTEGQMYYPDKHGKLVPTGPGDVRLPRKLPKSREIIKLVPSKNKEHVATVGYIYELFTHDGLTRRKISARLNEEGRTYYGKPFTHPMVNEILKNPAYVGDTHFGKTKAAANWSFNSDGIITKIETPEAKQRRDEAERIVKPNTHKGLISRKTWNMAQEKLADEEERTSYAPRNPEYYLHQLLVCGHCGKSMCGRTEIDPTDKSKKRIAYICSSYIAGRCNGQKSTCGAHRITHADAEQMLMDKIKEMKLEYDQLQSVSARDGLTKLTEQCYQDGAASIADRLKLINEGAEALCEYYHENYGSSPRQIKQLVKDSRIDVFATLKGISTSYYYFDDNPGSEMFTPKLADLARKAEADSVAQAKAKVAELTKKLNRYIELEADAGPAKREILKAKSEEIEADIKLWTDRTKPVSERLRDSYTRAEDLTTMVEQLKAELSGLNEQEKGEALRRVFKTVTLYWDKKFIPRSDKPSRPIKTDRPGRNAFTLLKGKIGWEFSDIKLSDSW